VNQASSYLGVSPERVAKAVAATGIDAREFTFVDLGCGKGRALLVAAQLGFRQVIGVEFADELPEIARENARIMGFGEITVIQGDAGEFRFPAGDLVVFLYNPFWIPVMRRVVENLRRADYGRLFVLYLTPKIPEILDEAAFLERIESPDDPPHGTILYRGKPGRLP
jgi:SAM-dependent methyltransferase